MWISLGSHGMDPPLNVLYYLICEISFGKLVLKKSKDDSAIMVWEIYHSSRWIEVWKIPTISTNCLVLNESCWLIHRTSICLVIKKLPIIVEISSPKPPVTVLLVIFLVRVRLVIHMNVWRFYVIYSRNLGDSLFLVASTLLKYKEDEIV